MLNKYEVAELLRVHPNTVDKFVKEGMPSYKVGKIRRYDEQEVLSWFKERGK